MEGNDQPSFTKITETARTATGESLADISRDRPTLVVFLRPVACAFTGEALAMIADCRTVVAEQGARIIVVHPESDERAATALAAYGIGDLPRIADTNRALAAAFGVHRGAFSEVYGLRALARRFRVRDRREPGSSLRACDRMLPGAFLLQRGMIVRSFRGKHIGDRPDFVALSRRVALDGGMPRPPGGEIAS